MKPIQLLAMMLAAGGLIDVKIEKCVGEFRVRVNSVAQVFAAEPIVSEFNRLYGHDADVAF